MEHSPQKKMKKFNTTEFKSFDETREQSEKKQDLDPIMENEND